jgi:hypothetical protein
MKYKTSSLGNAEKRYDREVRDRGAISELRSRQKTTDGCLEKGRNEYGQDRESRQRKKIATTGRSTWACQLTVRENENDNGGRVCVDVAQAQECSARRSIRRQPRRI